MNARELNEIFEKYGIGHVRLEKPFEEKTIAYINNYKYAAEIWDRLAKMR